MNPLLALLQRLPGSIGLRRGHAWSVGEVTAAQLANIPCNVTRRGEERRMDSGAGVADRKRMCRKDDTNTYEWGDELIVTDVDTPANVGANQAGYSAIYNIGGADPNAVHGGIWPEEARMGFTIARRFTSGGGANGPTVALTSHIESGMATSTGAAHVATAYGMVQDSAVFAENLIALGADATGVKLVGLEIDVLPFSGRQPHSATGGLFINAFNVAMDNAPAIMINGFTPGRWKFGLLINGIHTDGVGVGVQAGAPEMEWGIHLNNGTYGTTAAQFGAQNDKPALILNKAVSWTSSNILEVKNAASSANYVVIDGNGQLGIGVQPAAATPLDLGSAMAETIFARYSADANAPALRQRKSRHATVGSHTVVQSGDTVGNLAFQGSDGTNWITAAQIIAVVDGTPGANDMPGRLDFRTTQDGASAATTWMRLTSDGGLGLVDGITAPSTETGFALLYIDTADGDFKIKFADGTVKTIATDT